MHISFRLIQRYSIISLFFVFITGSLIWYYYPTWTTSKVDFMIARPGTIEYKADVKAVFANSEFPVYAPASGTITISAKENQRYRRGEVIGTIQAQTAVSIIIQEGGLFYPYVDGLEKVFSYNQLVNMELSSLLAQKSNPIVTEQMVISGSPIGKVVNNHKPTAAFIELTAQEGLRLKDLKIKQKLKFEMDNRTYGATVIRKSEHPLGFVVEFESFVENSVKQREKNIVWNYKNSPEGILLPKQALWIKGEEKGVFVVAEGVIRFRRIKILDQNETTVCVEGLPLGITVLTTPHEGLEGLLWNGKNQ